MNNELKFNGNTTMRAVEFYESYKDSFGEVVKAELINGRGHLEYILTLVNNEGDKMIFTGGLNSGYLGEGPRGTQKILNMAGFNITDEFILENKIFNIEKEGR